MSGTGPKSPAGHNFYWTKNFTICYAIELKVMTNMDSNARLIKYLFLFFLLLTFMNPNNAIAHPGRTASDGCHYCRTNCSSWGVPWDQRHCHGGSISLPPPAPKVETWTFNGKIYNSYNDYLEAKATYEAEQRRKQEEENKQLQREIDSLRSSQDATSDDEEGIVAGIINEDSNSSDMGVVAPVLTTLILLIGGGWYYLKKRKVSK